MSTSSAEVLLARADLDNAAKLLAAAEKSKSPLAALLLGISARAHAAQAMNRLAPHDDLRALLVDVL
jgi:hypothetical protein